MQEIMDIVKMIENSIIREAGQSVETFGYHGIDFQHIVKTLQISIRLQTKLELILAIFKQNPKLRETIIASISELPDSLKQHKTSRPLIDISEFIKSYLTHFTVKKCEQCGNLICEQYGYIYICSQCKTKEKN